MADIPPWIVTPDAAGRYMQGYSLGLDVAQRRAAQAVQQQQMALQQQSMEQQKRTNAEIAARHAIQLQLDEQFRSAQLAADAAKLAQAKTLAEQARNQAAVLAREEMASREKIAGMKGGTNYGQLPSEIQAVPVKGGGKTIGYYSQAFPNARPNYSSVAGQLTNLSVAQREELSALGAQLRQEKVGSDRYNAIKDQMAKVAGESNGQSENADNFDFTIEWNK